MQQRLLFIGLGLLMFFVPSRSEDCLKVRDNCLESLECGYALGEIPKSDVCGESDLFCLMPETQKTFCVQMLQLLRRSYHLHQCTCNPSDTECKRFYRMITRHPCEVEDGEDIIYPTPSSKPTEDYSSSKSDKTPLSSILSWSSYETDFSSGSSWYSSVEETLNDCWTEINRCRRNKECDNALTIFEMACSCEVTEYFACASDAPKCQEARNALDAFNLVSCGCPENMNHRNRCRFVYDKLFNNPCIDGCRSHIVQSDTALEAKILPYQDAVNKCTETEDGCLDYLLALSAACHNCSQARCQRATDDFIRYVDPIISHSVLFSNCKDAADEETCLDTSYKRECALTVSPIPNCLELPVRCQSILGCQVQFQNFQNHCDPNRCDRDVYTSCRTAYAALFGTPIAINCTCDPEDVLYPQCRVFQRRVSENSCIDKSILYFQDPKFEGKKHHGTCNVRIAGETKSFRIKTDTFIRLPTAVGKSSLCQCKADGQIGYCHDIPLVQNLSCDDNQSMVYNNENETKRRNGICVCVDGDVICSKPQSDLNALQLNSEDTYLFIGYRSSELQYISKYIGEQVSDFAFLKLLQELLDKDSKVTSKCQLTLTSLKTQGNLLLKSMEEEGDPKKTSVACIGSLMHLASMINGRKPPMTTSPVLSVLKIASVDHLDFNSPQRLSLQSGIIQRLPHCISSLIVLALVLVLVFF